MQTFRCEMMDLCTQVLEMMYEKILEDEFKNLIIRSEVRERKV